MTFATLLSWGAWGFVMWNTNPFEAGISGFSIYYLTMLMGLIGLITIVGLSYRALVLGRREIISREVRISFRHGVALGLLGVVALILSSQNYLKWWLVALMIAGMAIVEYFFLVKDEARRS